jgi:endogenous inhibitor of DNA gyrase (YacG/DUF329 family)
LIDLGAWASEKRTIPGEAVDAGKDQGSSEEDES